MSAIGRVKLEIELPDRTITKLVNSGLMRRRGMAAVEFTHAGAHLFRLALRQLKRHWRIS
jgi:hypothetical protein